MPGRLPRCGAPPSTCISLNSSGSAARLSKWRGPESNRRHHDFQSCALPTELPRRAAVKRSASFARERVVAEHGRMKWLRDHDPGYAALRRAARAALVMPAMFAFAAEVIGNPAIATFAAFGSFAMLVLVEFGGSMRERLEAQVALALTGAALVCLGTLLSRSTALAVAGMAVVG